MIRDFLRRYLLEKKGKQAENGIVFVLRPVHHWQKWELLEKLSVTEERRNLSATNYGTNNKKI